MRSRFLQRAREHGRLQQGGPILLCELSDSHLFRGRLVYRAARGAANATRHLAANAADMSFGPNNAALTLNADGSFTFTPDALLARTEITFSNSLIESWWRVLKHQWLFLNWLDTVTTVRKLVAFYVEEHNSQLPHSAFRGQTPDESPLSVKQSEPKSLNTARAWH